MWVKSYEEKSSALWVVRHWRNEKYYLHIRETAYIGSESSRQADNLLIADIALHGTKDGTHFVCQQHVDMYLEAVIELSRAYRELKETGTITNGN